MRTIRKADLNIVTAEWVGWGSRTDTSKATRMQTVLASTDPIALDFYGTKYLVYPLSKDKEHHDPENPKSSVRKFLDLTLKSLGTGKLNKREILVYA